MRVSSIGSVLALGLLWAVVSASGCGGEDKKSDPGGSAGSAGSGGSGGATGGTGGGTSGGSGGTAPGSKMCGTETCSALQLPFPGAPAIPACCPPDSENTCGLDTTLISAFGPSFEEPCQPLDQPGELDPECPGTDSVQVPDAGLSVQFPGCCRSNGQCGYLVDEIRIGGVLPVVFGLGCVDAAPFLDGGAPQSCNPDGGGQGGAGGQGGTGQGGEGGDGQGGTASGGAPGDGGAAGDTSSAGMNGN